MTLVGVLTNPGSTRNMQQGLEKTRHVIEQFKGVFHYEIETIADIPAALQRFAEFGAEVIAINGGDGTIREVFSALLNNSPFEKVPLIALLPAGKTNMMAEDFGAFGNKPDKYLRHLLERCRDGDVGAGAIERHVLKISGIPDQPPLYGMFLGTAGIINAIHFCRRRIYPMGLPNALSHLLVVGSIMAGTLIGGLFGRSPFRTDPIHVYVDDKGMVMGRYFVVTITTLERFILGLRPFGGEGRGPIKFLSVEDSPMTILKALIMTLTGSIRKRAAVGVTARNVSAVKLRMTCPLTVDGELYEIPANQELEVSGNDRLRFVNFAA